MIKAGGLQVPQIVVTEDQEETSRIPSVKIRIECVSSSEDDDDVPRSRLRPNAYRLARTRQETVRLTPTTNHVSRNVTPDRCLFISISLTIREWLNRKLIWILWQLHRTSRLLWARPLPRGAIRENEIVINIVRLWLFESFNWFILRRRIQRHRGPELFRAINLKIKNIFRKAKPAIDVLAEQTRFATCSRIINRIFKVVYSTGIIG